MSQYVISIQYHRRSTKTVRTGPEGHRRVVHIVVSFAKWYVYCSDLRC